MQRESDLTELVVRLREAAGANLQAVVLYGSAADHEFHEKHSDLNVLCILHRAAGPDLAKLRPVGQWWWSKGHPSPLIFTIEELKHSADVFAIELLDMKRQHRMLWGEDFFGGLEVPTELHRLQVERELRVTVLKLRQAYVASRGKNEELTQLMIDSISSVATLFRHSLMVLGEKPPDSKRDAAHKLALATGANAAGLAAAFDIREGKRHAAEMNVEKTFGDYLDAVAHVAEEMDRRLPAS